ncbi:MAG: AAA family ATPase [Candidatus Levybacteria bacterium]|nr:AAA family ATPase [Candidatus Levybacteria bacterium]
MKKIVVTGGPCGGKSTTIEAAKAEFAGKILTIPEPATMLMSTGFPAPGRDLPYSEQWQHIFQSAISPLHFNIEAAFELVAGQTGAQIILCDRGILDGAAYFPGGLPAFLRKFGLDEQECYDRYDCVIHLESTATCSPSLFGKAGNATRYESLDEAIALEHRTREAWKGHPNWIFISGENGIKDVVAQVLSIVSEYIDVEIERKFLVKTMDFDFERFHEKAVNIRQGYVAVGDGGELRIRKFGNEYFIASKGDGTLRRTEWERPLPKSAFDRLSQFIVGEMIEKTRFFIRDGKYLVEFDVFLGSLSGLTTLECEFSSEEEASAFVLPDWAKDAVEVTEDPAFKNKNLALYGLPMSR